MGYDRFAEIDLDEVDLSDTSFLISFPLTNPTLEKALTQTKIITPVWVLAEKPYRLVHGFRRLALARSLGIKRVPAIILRCEPKEAFRQALLENLFRGLNLIEKAHATEKMFFFGFTKNEVAECISLMGLGRGEIVLETLIGLSKVNEAIKTYIVENSLSLKTSRYLLSLKEYSLEKLIGFLKGKRVSESLLREFLENLILAEVKLGEIPFSELESFETIEDARLFIKKKLNPSLSKISHDLKEVIGSMEFPPNVKIGVDPYLEREEIEISISARNISEFRVALGKISRAYEEGKFYKLFEVYEGKIR